MPLDEFYTKHFDRERYELMRYWSRIGGRPSFEGLKVLDFGCSLGAMCVDIGTHGASKVIGLDIQQKQIDFAKENVESNYAEFKDTIKFNCMEIAKLPENDFDIILSKDVFEHVQGEEVIQEVLLEMKKRLKSGGKIYLGWGPLWNSPFGDHKLSKNLLPLGNVPIPWGHLLVSESFLINRVNKRSKQNFKNIRECGLNQLSYKTYEKIIQNSGLNILSYQVNVTTNPSKFVVSIMRKIPFLTNLLTSTVYCILQKD